MIFIMKKLAISTFILTLCYITSFSQTNVLLRDDFTNNHNEWNVTDDEYVSSKIKKGLYVLRNKSADYVWRFWKDIYLDQSEDFYIETKMKHTAGDENHAYGIIWGTYDWANGYNFVITSSGYFKIYSYKNEKGNDIQDWKVCKSIKPKGQYNVLAIKRKGSIMYFYVNGTKVHSCRFLPFHGTMSGFLVQQEMTVAVDYFLIKHPPVTINLIENAISDYPKENLGKKINSEYSEIAPIISPDGNTLYVARKDHPESNAPGKYDIWVSTRNKAKEWSELKKLGKPLNNNGDNLVISVTPDGNTLLLEGLYNFDGSYINDKGISISHKTKTGWSVPKRVIIKNYYNRNEYESFCHSVDRKVLIMSVQRDDTYGLKDLYVSFLQGDGTYSVPKNMGKDINTYANEGTPFLAPDGKTLYFYSYGHPGYGSADIFVSKRLDDTWTSWSKPKNLGPQINTKDWETYYTVPASGDYAYLVSDDESLGYEDIYAIKLQDEAKPEPVVLVSGKVFDKKTNKPVQAEIVYEDLDKNTEVGRAVSDPNTGDYQVVLPYGTNYGLRADAENYFSVSENLNIKEEKEYIEIEKNLYLSPVKVGEVVVLNNIFFDRGKSELKKASYAELDRVVGFLKKNPSVKIEIGGHTEITHADPKLSQDRANGVKNYLVENGIDKSRVTAVGYANTKPVVQKIGEDAQRLNRRVEFKILEK